MCLSFLQAKKYYSLFSKVTILFNSIQKAICRRTFLNKLSGTLLNKQIIICNLYFKNGKRFQNIPTVLGSDEFFLLYCSYSLQKLSKTVFADSYWAQLEFFDVKKMSTILWHCPGTRVSNCGQNYLYLYIQV